jgi:uncharacterized protein with PIN domain
VRLAKQKRRCPTCGEMLTGLVRRVETYRPIGKEEKEQTIWICETCDTEWVCLRGRGLVDAEQREREVDEEEERA